MFFGVISRNVLKFAVYIETCTHTKYIYIYEDTHLRVPWIARKSNQSILKEINPEYSLEALMLKPKLQYFGQY